MGGSNLLFVLKEPAVRDRSYGPLREQQDSSIVLLPMRRGPRGKLNCFSDHGSGNADSSLLLTRTMKWVAKPTIGKINHDRMDKI